MTNNPIPRIRAALVVAVTVASLPACDLGFASVGGIPTDARLTVEGSSATGTVRIVTSTAFGYVEVEDTREGQMTQTQEIQFAAADTSVANLPFEASYDISNGNRFFVAAASPDSSEATFTVRVAIDGAEKYNDTQTVTDEPIQFAYVFRSFR